MVYVFLLTRHSPLQSLQLYNGNRTSSRRILLFANLRIHGKLTRHSETRSLPPLPLSLLSFILIAMNILFRVSLLVLIINFVAAAPEPLAVSEARPDTFVVAKIPGV